MKLVRASEVLVFIITFDKILLRSKPLLRLKLCENNYSCSVSKYIWKFWLNLYLHNIFHDEINNFLC